MGLTIGVTVTMGERLGVTWGPPWILPLWGDQGVTNYWISGPFQARLQNKIAGFQAISGQATDQNYWMSGPFGPCYRPKLLDFRPFRARLQTKTIGFQCPFRLDYFPLQIQIWGPPEIFYQLQIQIWGPPEIFHPLQIQIGAPGEIVLVLFGGPLGLLVEACIIRFSLSWSLRPTGRDRYYQSFCVLWSPFCRLWEINPVIWYPAISAATVDDGK